MIETLNMTELMRIGVETTLATSVLILLVLLLRRPLAKHFGANIVYALWALPILRLVMPPLPGWMSLQLWSFSETETLQQTTIRISEFSALAEAPTILVTRGPALPELTVAPAVLGIDTAASQPIVSTLLPYLPMALLIIWATGAIIFLARHIRRQIVFASLLRAEAHPASLAIQTLGADLQKEIGLRRRIPLKTSLVSNGPLVAGLFRPFILLPEWFEEDFTHAEQCDAIRHEMTHLKRGDLWALHLGILGLAAQWFNPLAYIALRAFRSDQEAACDADVLKNSTSSPQSYGRTIIKAVRLSSASSHDDYATGLTMTHAIKERLVLMQKPVPSRRRRLSGSVFALTLALGGLAITASTGTAQTVLYGNNDNEEHNHSDLQGDEENSFRYSFNTGLRDRQMVLLADPFETLEPRLSAVDLGDMPVFEMEFPEEFFDFSNFEMPVPPVPPIAPHAPQITTEKTENGVRITIPHQEFEFTNDMEGFEEQMEVFGARMEAFGEMMEARGEQFEALMEARNEGFEARMEAWGERFEHRMETQMEGLEEELEDAADVVETLADDCSDHEFTNSQPVIFSASSDETGKTYRALCVKGDRDQIKSDEVTEFVANHYDLSDEEKARFHEHRDTRYYINLDD